MISVRVGELLKKSALFSTHSLVIWMRIMELRKSRHPLFVLNNKTMHQVLITTEKAFLLLQHYSNQEAVSWPTCDCNHFAQLTHHQFSSKLPSLHRAWIHPFHMTIQPMSALYDQKIGSTTTGHDGRLPMHWIRERARNRQKKKRDILLLTRLLPHRWGGRAVPWLLRSRWFVRI